MNEPLSVRNFDPIRIPDHVAVIMDGNRRWSELNNLPILDGYRAGRKTVQRLVDACIKVGISYLSIYTFSTENWNRPKHTIDLMLRFLEEAFSEGIIDNRMDEVSVRVIGDIEDCRIPDSMRIEIDKLIAHQVQNKVLTLTIAFNYGGRSELLAAVRKIVERTNEANIDPSTVTDSYFSALLETHDIPDPDLIIRTGGYMRLSNFLLWQSWYSELWFTSTLWPDFSEDEFYEALIEFQGRKRLFGR